MSAEIINDAGELDREAASDLIDQQLAALHDDEETTEEITNKDVASASEKKDETTRQSDEKSPEGEATGASDEQASGDDDDWISAQDVQELIESFGYTAEDLEQFGTREALDQHVKLMDRQFMDAGKSGEQEAGTEDESEGEGDKDVGKPRDKSGRFVKPDDTKTDEGDFEVKLDPEEYEEDLISEIKRSHDTLLAKLQESEARVQSMLDERLATQEARHAEANKAAFVQQFDQIVDQLDDLGDVFGKAERLTDDTFKSRSRLWDATTMLLDGMAKHGKKADLSAGLIRRALNMEFSDELKKNQQRSFNSRVQKQAGRKLGNSSNKASIEKEYDGPIQQDPELHAAYNAMLEQSGAL